MWCKWWDVFGEFLSLSFLDLNRLRWILELIYFMWKIVINGMSM